MDTSSNSAPHRARTNRIIRVSKTARAIRSALALSAAMLALAGSGVAFAGTCTPVAPISGDTVNCDGVFITSISFAVDDLTVIVGGVDPATTVTTAGVDGVHLGGAFGPETLVNYGSISTDVSAAGANAVQVYSAQANVSLTNSGDIYAYGSAGFAVTAASVYSAIGDVLADNQLGGTITAYADAAGGSATGLDAHTAIGDTTVTNAGDITATAIANSGIATGITAHSAIGDVSVSSDGTVVATSSGDLANAYGIDAHAAIGYVDVGNGGSVSVTASGVGSDAIGINAYTTIGDITVNNDGNITSTIANAGTGEAWGIYANALGDGNVSVYNSATGSIAASVSDGGGDVWAITAYSQGTGTITVGNDGTLTATTVNGSGDAYGITAEAYGDGAIYVSNSATGVIGAYAGGAGAVGGPAYGIYAVTHGLGDVTLGNDGTITATSQYGEATGVYAFSLLGDITLDNTGDILAYVYAGPASVGVSLCAALGNTATVNNIGSITGDVAISTCDAAAVINNSGLIDGDIVTAAGDDYIYNSGTIDGAILTGAGDDYFYNAVGGTLNATGSSDFGLGDDTIFNAGVINMVGATISLGDPGVAGNNFYNEGTIAISGDNHIDLGLANPNPFYNDGVLDFQDGAPNDTLTITGDFAGSGDINVDVSGLNGTSDMLYVEGSVVAGTVNTINVDLVDLSTLDSTLIPIVSVTGDSVASNFVLGTVDFDAVNNFLSVDFGLNADIDATNVTPDVFSLAIDITGLSDPGTLAASIGPGVMSLMNSQVGTWRQRMGVIDQFNKGAISLWARVFQDKGSFTPEHFASNFGQAGNFDFDQRNRGVEAGIDFSVTDEFSLGLLLGKSKANSDLNGLGIGSSELDARTWGIYGTWISPEGFYLDTSYRWMRFDVDMDSVAGAMSASGKATAFNVELGYAFTMDGGLKIEPQLQYTRTNVSDTDLFTTSTGMDFLADGGDSSRGRVGVAFRKNFGDADDSWMWTPYLAISAVREFDGESRFAVNNTFIGQTSTKGTSGLLELGFTARHENLSIYGGLNWQDGGALNSFVGGQLGVRYTFGGEAPAPEVVAVVAPTRTCADMDDDGDGVNNCDDKCPGSTAGQPVGPDGCPVPAPEPEPVMEPKPFRG